MFFFSNFYIKNHQNINYLSSLFMIFKKKFHVLIICESAAQRIDTFNGRVKDYEQTGIPVYIK